jgi:hypothetical protein
MHITSHVVSLSEKRENYLLVPVIQFHRGVYADHGFAFFSTFDI